MLVVGALIMLGAVFALAWRVGQVRSSERMDDYARSSATDLPDAYAPYSEPASATHSLQGQIAPFDTTDRPPEDV